MQCVILAGGLGTRMWPEARTIPKTLLPVAGTPFATWQLSWLARSGIDSVVYCVGYLGQMIRDHVGDRVVCRRAPPHAAAPHHARAGVGETAQKKEWRHKY